MEISSSENHEETLGLCLIAKDEENNISRCIESVQDIIDELVVVDTGSRDNTVKIAESLGAKIYHYPWDDNFSNARNFAMGQAKSAWIKRCAGLFFKIQTILQITSLIPTKFRSWCPGVRREMDLCAAASLQKANGIKFHRLNLSRSSGTPNRLEGRMIHASLS